MCDTSVYLLRRRDNLWEYYQKLCVDNQHFLGQADGGVNRDYSLAVCVESDPSWQHSKFDAPFNFELERLDTICNRLMRLP